MVLLYKISDASLPMKIHDNMGVHVFLDQKRSNIDFFSRYQLCITIVNKDIELMVYKGSWNQQMQSYTIGNTKLLSSMKTDVNEEGEEIEIIQNMQHDVVVVDQVYKSKSIMFQFTTT